MACATHSPTSLQLYLDNRNQRYYFKAITSMKISSLLRNVSCIDLREENSTSITSVNRGARLHYGKFLISKLKRTQGLTFANTLRRILLYEVPTAGITSVKFQTKYMGYSSVAELPSVAAPTQIIHEFSRIPGVYESLLELTMNLESVILKKDSEYGVISKMEEGPSSFQYATITIILPELANHQIGPPIEVVTPHIIQAKDLILPSGFSVVYPDQYIATLMGGQISVAPQRRNCGETDVRFAAGAASQSRGEARATQSGATPGTSQPGEARAFTVLIVNCGLESHESEAQASCSSEAHAEAQLRSGPASQSRGSYARQSPSAHAQAQLRSAKPMQSEVAATKLNKKSAPVKKVNYTIENAADPNQGEQVIFEIWTNGAISPQDAFAYGIQYAVKLFQQFLPEV
jgi:DNA-directed RNA polymerase alpha subunit